MKVALLFTDIEGSTRLLEKSPDEYARMLRQHHGLLRAHAGFHGGREFQDVGDGILMAFDEPLAAGRAARAMQDALSASIWPELIGPPRVRMALHWAEAEFRDGQYRGAAMHAASRFLSAAHGGQVLCSQDAADALDGKLGIRRLGVYRMRGFEKPEAVFQLEDGIDFPALRAEHARRHNLPASLGVFVGREQEVTQIEDCLVNGRRLVTLSGPGGVGKTRLALAAASRVLDYFEHSVFQVSLAEATDASAIPGVILSALGASPESSDRQAIKKIRGILAETPTLLVLDNMEQFSAEGGLAVGVLLRDLPMVSFLVTSRFSLGVAGEVEIPVAPLPVPQSDSFSEVETNECAKLFAERAALARPGFRLDPCNAASVGPLCRLLDGLPLALELAAARLQVMTVQELLETLSADFSLLSGGVRGLEAVFSWSRRLLPPDVADFLGDLSVFRGGWTVQAASEVADLPSSDLARAFLHYLLTCSLIRASEFGEKMRFSMLEPVRHHAEVSLEERKQEVENRHRRYFLALAREVNRDFGTEREEALIRKLDPETANVLAAIERTPENRERLFAAVDFHEYAVRRSCNRQVYRLLVNRRPDGGEVPLPTSARAWNAAGILALRVQDLESAESAFRQAAELFQENGEHDAAAAARFNLGSIAQERGRIGEAFEIFRAGVFYYRGRHAAACARVLSNLGNIARRLDRLEEGREYLLESLNLCEQGGFLSAQAHALCNLGELYLSAGDWREAASSLKQSLDLRLRLGEEFDFPDVLVPLGVVALTAGSLELAAYFCGAAEAARDKTGRELATEVSFMLLQLQRSCRDGLGDAAFCREAGRGSGSRPEDWQRAAGEIGGSPKTTLAIPEFIYA